MRKLAWILIATLALCVSTAWAQDAYPNRPIKFVVSMPAGSATDTQARVIGDELHKSAGQPVVIENKPGLFGVLAVREFIRSNSDGYTLLFGSGGTMELMPPQMNAAGFDPVKDMEAVVFLGDVNFVILTRASLPVRTLDELKGYARSLVHEDKNTLNYADATPASKMFGNMMSNVMGIEFAMIPYKGSPEVLNDFRGGRLDVILVDVMTAQSLIADGTARALAAIGPRRSAVLPGVPSTREAGYPQFDDVALWAAIFAPKGTPPDIVAAVRNNIEKVLVQPEIKSKLRSAALEVRVEGSQALTTRIAKNLAFWEKAVKKYGIKKF